MCVIHIGDYADKDSIYFANRKINKDFKVFRDFKVFSVIKEGKADKARLDNPSDKTEVLFVGALAFNFVKDDFAYADMIGCHLHIFVTFNIFQGFLKAEYHRGYDTRFVIGSGSSHIGEFL